MPIGPAMSIAIIVTMSVPSSSVAMSNMPRRGNQPGATSCERSILRRNSTACSKTVRMMKAVMKTETSAAAKNARAIHASRLRRARLPTSGLDAPGAVAVAIDESPPESGV
jgi:hypothetical protein